MKELNKKTYCLRNPHDVSFEETLKGFDVLISGRWLGRDTEIFLSFEYIGCESQIALKASNTESYMKGYATPDEDKIYSPVRGVEAYFLSNGNCHIEVRHKSNRYTRAQNRLIPELLGMVLPNLPVAIEKQIEVLRVRNGYEEARTALRALKESRNQRERYEEKMEVARRLLGLDDMGIETLVALGAEGGDIHVLAQSMDTLLR